MIYIRLDIKDIENKIEILKKYNVGAEITLYDTDYILTMSNEKIQNIKNLIDENNIPIVVHLPMYAVDYGTKDTYIREYSVKVCLLALEIAKKLGATKAVFHSGFNPLNPPSVRKKWLEIFQNEFIKIINKAEEYDIIIASENVWDLDSEFFDFLNENINSKHSKFCFDIGHSQIYFKNINHEEWLKKNRDNITHIHVHDNNMETEDDHAHIGEGKINFSRYFDILKNLNNFLTYTLEVKIDEKIENDIFILKKYLEK